MTGGVFFTPRETSNGGECGKTTKGGKDIKGTSDIIVRVGTDEWPAARKKTVECVNEIVPIGTGPSGDISRTSKRGISIFLSCPLRLSLISSLATNEQKKKKKKEKPVIETAHRKIC